MAALHNANQHKTDREGCNMPIKKEQHNCPECIDGTMFVVDSRPKDGYRRRRYECDKCNHRHSTVEVPVDIENRGNGASMIALQNKFNEFNDKQIEAVMNLLKVFKNEGNGVEG
jgi:transcriptional regulator NrdR family protein